MNSAQIGALAGKNTANRRAWAQSAVDRIAPWPPPDRRVCREPPPHVLRGHRSAAAGEHPGARGRQGRGQRHRHASGRDRGHAGALHLRLQVDRLRRPQPRRRPPVHAGRDRDPGEHRLRALLGFSGPESKLDENAGGTDMAPIEMEHIEALGGLGREGLQGISERWLAQLLSPALVEWLGRCDPDFGFELASGVLCAGRNGHIEEPRQPGSSLRFSSPGRAALRGCSWRRSASSPGGRSRGRRRRSAACPVRALRRRTRRRAVPPGLP